MRISVFIFTALCILGGCGGESKKGPPALVTQDPPAPLTKTIIYETDFSGSLADFSLLDNDATISIDSEALVIDVGDGTRSLSGYAVLDLNNLSEDYIDVLGNNVRPLSISFNVWNQNAAVCGACNNGFVVGLYSSAPVDNASVMYQLMGGSFVGDRMLFMEAAGVDSSYGRESTYIMDIASGSGLSVLPSIGAFRLEYNPVNNEWSLYFEESTAIIDPTTINTLIATTTSDSYVSEAMPYLMLGGRTGGKTWFDNLTVALEVAP